MALCPFQRVVFILSGFVFFCHSVLSMLFICTFGQIHILHGFLIFVSFHPLPSHRNAVPVYTTFKAFATELSLALFMGLDPDENEALFKQVSGLATAHWHGTFNQGLWCFYCVVATDVLSCCYLYENFREDLGSASMCLACWKAICIKCENAHFRNIPQYCLEINVFRWC